LDQIVIATTTNKEDDPIIDLCNQLEILTYRGSETDVLERYYQASIQYPSRNVLRVTSDCPLLDPRIVDLCIHEFCQEEADYLSSSLHFPNGMNVEMFRFDMLKEARERGNLPYEREHVTPYFYTHPERFKIKHVRDNQEYTKYRLTVDTLEDFELIKILLERLSVKGAQFSLEDIIEEFNKDSTLVGINSHVVQKHFTEVSSPK